MFDIGFIEMLVIGLILLLVVGPERLPEVARTVGGWMHQAKQYLDGVKSELDRDLRLDELDRETRQSFKDLDRQTRESLDEAGREARQTFEDLDQEARRRTDLSAGAGEGAPQAGGGPEGSDPPPGDDRPESIGDADRAVSESRSEGDRRSAGEAPDPEDRAADDMERELKQDDEPDSSEDRRG